MEHMHSHHYHTGGGVEVYRASIGVDGARLREQLVNRLDAERGLLFSSSYEYPGRYSRWDIGFAAPPLSIVARGRDMTCEALNSRGEVLLRLVHAELAHCEDLQDLVADERQLRFTVRDAEAPAFEEERTRQRSVFSVLRRIVALFRSDEDAFLGLFGAFGYDLAFQFEDVAKRQSRRSQDRDMVLYLPDSILVIDHKRERAQQHFYDFAFTLDGRRHSTGDLPRECHRDPYVPGRGTAELHGDHEADEYAATVRRALGAFARGDLFEVVPGQSFSRPCPDAPSRVFTRLQQQNPAPYGALLNLGHQEYLVAASPEMYVRVRGDEVETCPISGTIARGRDAIEDAERIRTLLNSDKDEAELTMCTDVDRNDKSRVCRPGTVQVTGRRMIEMYSRLIHTVDQVTGQLQPGMDAIDAFLSHAWAVTVTGAPKHAAMQFIEDHEHSPRRFYGGAIGALGFNGNLNSGLTIRTIHLEQGRATVRAGATLLADSDPQAEEAETRLKASALLQALAGPPAAPAVVPGAVAPRHAGLEILMVDHQDSFVHMLASSLRVSGARVRTVRPQALAACLAGSAPDLIVLSPGPGRPSAHGLGASIELALSRGIPLFGVCLGLQGIVEYFGGSLRALDRVMHGRQSRLTGLAGPLFAGIERPLRVGRYHSLVADRVPDCLEVCARCEAGEVMALAHRALPVQAVQFHPESILSAASGGGQRLLENLLDGVARARMPLARAQ